jgi:hypothetical protein
MPLMEKRQRQEKEREIMEFVKEIILHKSSRSKKAISISWNSFHHRRVSVQHGKWKKWEIEHGNLKVSLRGTKVVVDF